MEDTAVSRFFPIIKKPFVMHVLRMMTKSSRDCEVVASNFAKEELSEWVPANR